MSHMPHPPSLDQTAPTGLLLSVKQAAAVLGISIWSTRQLLNSGEIPTTTIGARVFVPDAALREYVNSIGSRP